jgi:hypothetical protein
MIDNERFMHYEDYSLLGCDTVQFDRNYVRFGVTYRPQLHGEKKCAGKN